MPPPHTSPRNLTNFFPFLKPSFNSQARPPFTRHKHTLTHTHTHTPATSWTFSGRNSGNTTRPLPPSSPSSTRPSPGTHPGGGAGAASSTDPGGRLGAKLRFTLREFFRFNKTKLQSNWVEGESDKGKRGTRAFWDNECQSFGSGAHVCRK